MAKGKTRAARLIRDEPSVVNQHRAAARAVSLRTPPLDKLIELPLAPKVTLTKAKRKAAEKKALREIHKQNVKDIFSDVFLDLQAQQRFSLKTWAMGNPGQFYALCTKLFPVQLTGEGGGPIEVQNITFE